MWFRLSHWVKRYHSRMVKHHYQGKHYVLCLHHLVALKKWDKACYQQPLFAGYLAMCHYQLKDWSHLTQEVECALFLLRRHVKDSNEALLLWEELKSHLSDLRFSDQSSLHIRQELSDSRH